MASIVAGMPVVIVVCLIDWWLRDEIKWDLILLLMGIYLIGWCFGQCGMETEILTFGETVINGNTYVVEEVTNNVGRVDG